MSYMFYPEKSRIILVIHNMFNPRISKNFPENNLSYFSIFPGFAVIIPEMIHGLSRVIDNYPEK